MSVFIAISAGLCFSLVVYLGVYIRLIRKQRLEMLDWFFLSIATFNGIGLGFVMWASYIGRNDSYSFAQVIMNYDGMLSITHIVLSFLLILSALSGWYLAISIHKKFIGRDKNLLPSFKQELFLQRLVLVSWAMLIIAIICYWLYTRAYGGFIHYLDYSRAIRSGVVLVDNPFSFFQRFGSFSFFSSYVFYSIIIDKQNRLFKKRKIYLGFIISLFFSLYVLYSWVGRVGLVVYISTFFLGYILFSYKNIFSFIRRIVVFSFISLVFLIMADSILGRSGGSIGVIELFSKELSFPFVNFYFVSQLSDYRWFLDLIVAPLYLLPMRIWSGLFSLETASSFNTYVIMGARKGDTGISGEVPVDMLSFSFMQGNILGVLVVGVVWGCVLYIVQQVVYKIPVNSIRSVISANLILNISIISVLYGDSQHILVRNFYMIVGLILTWIFLKFRLKKI